MPRESETFMESTKRPAPTMPPAVPPRHAPEHAGVAGNGAPEGSNGHEEIDLNVPKPRAAWVVRNRVRWLSWLLF